MSEESAGLPGNAWKSIEPLLDRVERPSRYLGGEWNAPRPTADEFRVVLAYPDVYEIGMSNLGLQVLQEAVNEMPGCCCERVFSPWPDMEQEMRREGISLFSLETHRPVSSCGLFGISIPHELTCTNILNLIDLAGIPLHSRHRTDGPLVVGGGCGAANPEPLSPFFDLFMPGEAEDALPRLVKLVKEGAARGWSRQRLLEEACALPGVYVPSRYRVDYLPGGEIASVEPVENAPGRVVKSLAAIDRRVLPSRPLVPFCEAVHDRVNVEIFRGCTRGCRFCQAGMIYRPVRERPAALVEEAVIRSCQATGHDEVSLCSLSSTDYTLIEEVAASVGGYCRKNRMVMALPSLRMDGFSVSVAAGLDRGGRGGLTFAPEAGSERLRRVINKPIEETEMEQAVTWAVEAGRRRVKLYFMIGLPSETDEDVLQITRLVFRLRDAPRKQRLPAPAINVSVSSFVPKPHTPFQWVPQEDFDSIVRKQEILKSGLRARNINLSWHDSKMSMVESLLARGDRRLAPVVENAWRSGARFDSWSDHFSFGRWEDACREAGIDLASELYRVRAPGSTLPWGHICYGVREEFLKEEYFRAMEAAVTPDCRGGDCTRCGVCEITGASTELKGAWK